MLFSACSHCIRIANNLSFSNQLSGRRSGPCEPTWSFSNQGNCVVGTRERAAKLGSDYVARGWEYFQLAAGSIVGVGEGSLEVTMKGKN